MKEYLNKIVASGSKEDMECLGDIFQDLMCNLKEYKHNKYKMYKHKLHGMASNYLIDEELAHEVVKDMKPYGEVWNQETIYSAIGVDNHRIEDMYIVMNSLANDYSNVINTDDVETYIKLAHDWIDDVDAHENKVWWYFIH